jgi:hypothetical protein
LSTRLELLPALGKKPAAADEEKLVKYKEEQEQIKEKADELQKESKAHLARHIPLSCGVTMFQVAIAVGAVSVLTKKKAFWYVALAFGAAGIVALLLGL